VLTETVECYIFAYYKQKKQFKLSKIKISYRVNTEIRHPQIRIVGDGVESKVCTVNEAIRIAQTLDVDVVEINSNASPPVCKLIRYDKFLYEEKRKIKEKEKRDREQRVEVKELRFGPNTDTHDLEFKTRHAINFLNEGDKVKAVIKFTGREIIFKEQGERLLLQLAEKLQEYGIAESMPKLEGKRMFMTFRPKK